jgi:imidazolonepropionase
VLKKTLIYNPEKIYVPSSFKSVKDGMQDNVEILQDISIVIHEGKIDSLINTSKSQNSLQEYNVIDASGNIAMPGFVDSHTHIMYAGDRSEEFLMRSRGTSYLELLNSGNGILKTVRDTRNASVEKLVKETRNRLNNHLSNGVTTVEIKTGYGLNLETEARMIEAMDILQKESVQSIIKTLLPMHAIPKGINESEYVTYCIEKILPVLWNKCDFVDVFCDRGAFSVESTERFLKSAEIYNLKSRLHADEIENIGALDLLDRFPMFSVDHLLHSNRTSMKMASRRDTVATILPGTAFSLGEGYADAREWIDSRVPVAVASDVSPLSPVTDMKFHGNLALRFCRMKVNELFNGLTSIPAFSLNVQDRKGTLEKGYDADIIISNAKDLSEIFYDWTNVKLKVILKGKSLV